MSATRRTVLSALGAIAAAPPAFANRFPRAGNVILVRAAKGATTGTLRFGGREYPCALGRSGIVENKHEGDGGTPAGHFPLREVRYRADRLEWPPTAIPVGETKRDDGWCDAPADPSYNRPVRLPYPASAEAMWRDDELYDLLAVIGYNDAPVVPGAGSAIFLHVARIGSDGSYLATAGCIALELSDLLAVLAGCDLMTMIDIASIEPPA